MSIAEYVERNREQLKCNGFLILHSFLGSADCTQFTTALERATKFSEKDLSWEPEFDRLVADDHFTSFPSILLGPDVAFHHSNGRVCSRTVAAKPWHHDLDGDPAFPFSMLHLLVYPAGLSPEKGELIILPESHLELVDRHYPSQFGTGVLDGELRIHGEPGIALLIYSSLWHCRRSIPRLESGSRYDFNASYCTLNIARPERNSYVDRFGRMNHRLGNNPLLRPQVGF